MGSRGRAQTVLNEYAAGLGLGSLPLDDGGPAVLVFNDMPFRFRYDPQSDLLWITVSLGRMAAGNVPADNVAAYTYLLEIGLMSWVKDVFTLALDEADLAVAYTCMPASRITLTEFESLVERVFSVAQPLSQKIRGEKFDSEFLVEMNPAQRPGPTIDCNALA